jgi:hypothetical protein
MPINGKTSIIKSRPNIFHFQQTAYGNMDIIYQDKNQYGSLFATERKLSGVVYHCYLVC